MTTTDQIDGISSALGALVDEDFFSISMTLLRELSNTCVIPTELASMSDYSEKFFRELAKKEDQAVELIFAFEVMQLCIESFLALHLSNLGLNSSNNEERRDEFYQSTVSLLSYIQMNLHALKICALSISDLPARVLCRSVTEAADLLIAVQAGNGLAANWIDSQDDPRAFWHRNLSGKRLSQRRDEMLRLTLTGRNEELAIIAEHLKDESAAFSMATHPAYQAGIMGISEVFDGDAWYPIRTIRHTTHRASLALQVALVKCANRPIRLVSEKKSDAKRVRASIITLLRGAAFCSLVGVPGTDFREISKSIQSPICS